MGIEGAPLIRCYDVAYSEELRRYHLLLDDLSATHVGAAAKAPTVEYGWAPAEGLAAMRARWWAALRLTEAAVPIQTAEQIRRSADIAEAGAGHILRESSDALAPHWPELIRALCAAPAAADPIRVDQK